VWKFHAPSAGEAVLRLNLKFQGHGF
jgi:hypothetical protein